jgi:hypothetical protein
MAKCPEVLVMGGYQPEPCVVEGPHELHENAKGTIKWSGCRVTIKRESGNG